METTCKNCDHQFVGNFCNQCGQSSTLKRIDYQYFFSEIPNGIFNVNKGLFFTIKELTIRPGKAVREYLEGKRRKHFPPFAYVLVLTATYLILKRLLINVFLDDAEAAKHLQELSNKSNRGLLYLALSPCMGLFAYWLFRKRSKLNLWEYIIANIYLFGHAVFILMFLKLFFFNHLPVTEPVLTLFLFAPIFTYLTFAHYQMHRPYGYKVPSLIFRSFLIPVLGLFVPAFFVTLYTTLKNLWLQ